MASVKELLLTRLERIIDNVPSAIIWKYITEGRDRCLYCKIQVSPRFNFYKCSACGYRACIACDRVHTPGIHWDLAFMRVFGEHLAIPFYEKDGKDKLCERCIDIDSIYVDVTVNTIFKEKIKLN